MEADPAVDVVGVEDGAVEAGDELRPSTVASIRTFPCPGCHRLLSCTTPDSAGVLLPRPALQLPRHGWSVPRYCSDVTPVSTSAPPHPWHCPPSSNVLLHNPRGIAHSNTSLSLPFVEPPSLQLVFAKPSLFCSFLSDSTGCGTVEPLGSHWCSRGWELVLVSSNPTCRTSKAREAVRCCCVETIPCKRGGSVPDEGEDTWTSVEGSDERRSGKKANFAWWATLKGSAEPSKTCDASTCVASVETGDRRGKWRGKQTKNKEMDQGTRPPPIRNLARWSFTYPTIVWPKRLALDRSER